MKRGTLCNTRRTAVCSTLDRLQFAVRFDLGDLILDTEARQLLRAEADVRLSPKAFDFLALLVKDRPRVVSKSELHDQIWSGVFVSDASLAMVASEVRAALGESARAQSRIRTAHGRGYAFQGDARPLGAANAPAPSHWLMIGERAVPLHDGDNIVGREPGVDVWIDAATVSRRHARIRVSGASVTVDDLGSKNGTSVNDVPLTAPTPLQNGDALQLGSATTLFRQSADPTAPIVPAT